MTRLRAPSALQGLSRRSRLWWRRGSFAFLFIAACLYPVVVNNGFVLDIATDMALWAVLAIGLNAVLGWAGLLDLGYIAFFALGGYTYAILSSMHIMSFWPSLVVGPGFSCRGRHYRGPNTAAPLGLLGYNDSRVRAHCLRCRRKSKYYGG